MQAKGIFYNLSDLIPSKMADFFRNGSFITLYLSPGDYHRIHSPASGEILGFFNLPGKLFPVQEFIVKGIKGLFSKNERLISYLQTSKGKIAVCKIGALNVGKISLAYHPCKTNKTFRKKEEVFFSEDKKIFIEKGEDLGVFHLGSTVILLFEKDLVKFADLKLKEKVRVGDRIASFV
jgi:phosphatidylserine decarboxylase